MWTDGFSKSTDHWLTPSVLTTHLSLKVYLLLLKRVFTSGTQLLHSNCCRNILFTVWRNSLIISILSDYVNWGINEIKSVIFSWSCDSTWTHTRKIKHAFFFSKSTIFFYLHIFCYIFLIWKKNIWSAYWDLLEKLNCKILKLVSENISWMKSHWPFLF